MSPAVRRLSPSCRPQGGGLGNPAQREGEVQVPVAPGAQAVFDELALIPGPDHRRVSLHPDDGTELLEDAVSESVVRGHLDLPPVPGEVEQFAPEPFGELFGRLVGERDPEGLFRLDSGGDLVPESKHDGGGLAGAGARGDPERRQRVFDDRLLLVREDQPVGHVLNASLPSGRAGHTEATAQWLQAGPGVAGHRSAATPAATARIRSSISARAAGSNSRTVIPDFLRARGYQSSAWSGVPAVEMSWSVCAARR